MLNSPAAPEQMQALVGRWIGKGEVFANPFGPAGRSQGVWEFRIDGPGLHLIHDYRETRSDGYVFEGHGIFAIDPSTGEFVWYWFDTYGHPPLSPARGNWRGRILQLEKITARGIGRTRFGLEDGRLVHDVETRSPGADDFVPVTHAVFERETDDVR